MLRMRDIRAAALALALLAPVAHAAGAPGVGDAPGFDEGTALRTSQAAIGRQLADYRFRDSRGEIVRLSDFAGRPVLINLIYTSCSHYCPLTTQTLARGVEAAAQALGEDSFAVVTIGFDARNDNPARMGAYRRAQGIRMANWHFLSADAEAVLALTEEIGFIFRPSSQGFDHIAQTTLLDADRRVARQLYGSDLTVPQVVEPLKRLRAGQAAELANLDNVIERIRLFCTLYDPDRDAYGFDWSFFIGLAIGLLSIGLLSAFLASQLMLFIRTRV